jgi:hypothetical protein
VLLLWDDVRYDPSPAARWGFGVERAVLFRWDDVVEIDIRLGRLRANDLLEFCLRDGSAARITASHDRRVDGLYRLKGFEPHQSAAWPDRIRWAPVAVGVDWNARREPCSSPVAEWQPWD